jgi:hypothetical protein
MKAGDSHYQDRVVKLHDLLPDSGPPLIKGFSFDGCHILGPAVVHLVGETSLTRCTFEGDPNGIFLQLALEQEHLLGVIGLEACSFDRCKFAGISFIDKNRELRTRVEQS